MKSIESRNDVSLDVEVIKSVSAVANDSAVKSKASSVTFVDGGDASASGAEAENLVSDADNNDDVSLASFRSKLKDSGGVPPIAPVSKGGSYPIIIPVAFIVIAGSVAIILVKKGEVYGKKNTGY
jgi:hypothetical protein